MPNIVWFIQIILLWTSKKSKYVKLKFNLPTGNITKKIF